MSLASPPLDPARDLNDSHVSDLRSDKVDIDNPSSSVEEAVEKEHPEMNERPNLALDSGCPARVQVVEAQPSFMRGESQNSMMPTESWQDTTDKTSDDLKWREEKKEKEKEKEKFQDNATHSEAYASTDSESSSSTFGDEDSDAVTQEMPDDWEIEDTDETAARDNKTSFAMAPGEDLSLFPWLLWYLLCIWRWLQQDWQDFWTATHQSGEQPATPAPPGLLARQKHGSRGGKRRRERTDSADEAEREKPSAGKSKRARRSKEPGPSQPLACPFCKKDLQQYQACVKLNLTKVRYVKQHLHRKHGDNIEDWVMARLRLRSAPGTEEEQWYRIFDLLFPGHSPRPSTPYNDFTVCERAQPSPDTSPTEEALYVSGIFLTGESVQSLQQFLVQDSALASVAADDIRGALDRALCRVFMEQTSHQNPSVDGWQARAQQGPETDIEDSEESSNSRGFMPDREVTNSRFSDDSGVVTNEHPSSATVQSDPTPEPQGTQRGVGGAFEWEEFLNDDPILFIEGAPEDQQLGHQIDMDCWLNEWPFTNYDQPLGESSGAQA
ncbi:hypothetical protein FALCPG4_013674 [Fusarium falciforme]